MSHSFSASLPLSRLDLDRDYRARDRENLFEELWANPATRILVMREGAALLSSPTSLALLPVDAVPPAELRVYLGRSLSLASPEPVGTPIVAVQLDDAGDLAQGQWGTLRSLSTVLDDRDVGILTEALGVLNWHASHLFSPRTGGATVSEKGGWVRRDPVTGTEIFPRTDPAIIVAITDHDDRILLGSNALWEGNHYSLLAGFVEPGESLETAVAREVFEESGLRVIDPVYLGSQPWPFPASLMLGFTARVDPEHGTQTTPDGTEILDLRWFSRAELTAATGGTAEIRLPGPSSIARAMITRWYGGPLGDGL
ncbi:MAG: NAD(+) diphosphatase [Rhodoglobus sp.]